MAEEKVLIFDTTLRDGEQSAGIGLTTEEKVEIARQLEEQGIVGPSDGSKSRDVTIG